MFIYVFYFSFRFQDIPCNKKEFKFSWNPCYAYTLPGTQCDSVAVSTVIDIHVRHETVCFYMEMSERNFDRVKAQANVDERIMVLIRFGNTVILVILKKSPFISVIDNLSANMLATHYRHIYLLTVNSIK